MLIKWLKETKRVQKALLCSKSENFQKDLIRQFLKQKRTAQSAEFLFRKNQRVRPQDMPGKAYAVVFAITQSAVLAHH